MAKSFRTTPARRAGGGFLLGVFVGLVLGLAVAVGVAFYFNKTPLPFISKPRPPAKDAAGSTAPTVPGLPQSGAPGVAGKAAERPRFDFYKILPGSEETVSDRELKDAARNAKGQPQAAKDVFYIQAGSFQNPADADSLKARIAILGFESSVEPVNLPEKGTQYRVRMGPFGQLDELNRVRQALAQNGVEASLVRLKDTRSP